jgi:hypothetical protein
MDRIAAVRHRRVVMSSARFSLAEGVAVTYYLPSEVEVQGLGQILLVINDEDASASSHSESFEGVQLDRGSVMLSINP